MSKIIFIPEVSNFTELRQVLGVILQRAIDGLSKDISNAVAGFESRLTESPSTETPTVLGTLKRLVVVALEAASVKIRARFPSLGFRMSSGTTDCYIAQYVDGRLYITANLSFDGAAWSLIDTSKSAAMICVNGVPPSGNPTFQVFTAPASANPPTLTNVFQCTNSAVSVDGVQVLGTQQTDIGAASAVATVVTTQTSGATYTANEQLMLGNLKADVTNLRATLADFKTRLDNTRTVFQGHHLTT